MSATEAIRMAEATGIRIGVEGSDLILEADLEPTADVVNAIRRHKSEIIRLLAPPRDRWTGEDWRAYFNERVGIAEFGGGLPSPAAEVRAYECCVVKWLNHNPAPSSSADQCGECGEPITGTDALPFLNGPDGHAWIHPDCHGSWMERRRAIAQRHLAELGIAPR